MSLSTDDLVILAEGVDHAECVTVGPDGWLYAGGEAGQVYRVDPQLRSAEQIATTGGSVLGLCLDGHGTIYACDPARGAIVRIGADGQAVDWCREAGGRPLQTPNFAAFADDGSLWFTDSGTESLHVRDGRLIRVPPQGGAGEVQPLGPLHFPNGLCVDTAGDVLLLESLHPRLSRLHDGTLATIAEFPGFTPDGVACARDGSLLVACYYPFAILAVDRDGGVTRVLEDATGIHLPMPTNVIHYGENLASLAIGLLGATWIAGLPAPTPGVALRYPT